MASGGIRGSPLSYLRGLVARAKEDAFIPEAAVTVAAVREQRRRSKQALERVAARPPEFPPADPNHPLVTSIALEKEINTFFRLGNAEVIDKLRETLPNLPAEPDEKTVFLALRELRNSW